MKLWEPEADLDRGLTVYAADPHNYTPLTGNVLGNSVDKLGVATLNHMSLADNAVAQNTVR